jgi:hypothetical protein
VSFETSQFKLIRPVTVTDSILTSSTIPEQVAATYSGGTTYAAGDLAGAASTYGAAQTVWRSLQAGNTGNAQVEGVWWTLAGTVSPVYASGSSCNIGGIVTDLATHTLYESLVNSNTGNALSDATKWKNIGATNRWKMFDGSYQTQSTALNSFSLVLTPGEIVNSLALLNVEGTSATVTQSVSGYSSTVVLVRHDVLNWFDWYYEVPIRTGDAVFTDIPPYPASTLTIEVVNTGDTAKCGTMVVGKSRTLGLTEWEFSRSINDYSRAVEDANGTVELVQGAYSKRMVVDVWVEEGMESEVTRVLEEYRAQALVFVGSSAYSMAIIYGFLGAWNVPVSIRGRNATIEIKGLI